MPTHRVHRDICRLLGYDIELCQCVNEAIDRPDVHDIGRIPPSEPLTKEISVGYPPWSSLLEYLPRECSGELMMLLELAFIHHLADWICESWYSPRDIPGSCERYVEEQVETMVRNIEYKELKLGLQKPPEPTPREVWERVKYGFLQNASEICQLILSDQMCTKRKEHWDLRTLLEVLDCLKIRGTYWMVNGRMLPNWAPAFTTVNSRLSKGERVTIMIGPCKVEGSRYDDVVARLLECLKNNANVPCIAERLRGAFG